jgi:hypothetical protein
MNAALLTATTVCVGRIYSWRGTSGVTTTGMFPAVLLTLEGNCEQ